MSFIQQLKQILGCREDELQQQIVKKESTITNLEEEVRAKDESVQKLKDELDRTKAYSELSRFEKYLKERFQTVKLNYGKRYMVGKPNVPISMDVRDYLTTCKTLLKFNFRTMKEIWEFYIQYVYDSENQKYNEFWELPTEVAEFRCGDCEDSSIFRICASHLIGENDVAMALGYYMDEKKQKIGHAFPLYYNYTNQEMYVLEATTNIYKPILISKTSMKSSDEKYEIFWIISKNECFVVNNSIAFGQQVKEEFNINPQNKRINK